MNDLLTKEPNVEQINIKMDKVDQLYLQNMLYKIQLEQERVKVAKLQLANAELKEKLISQELKIWEGTYQRKLSDNKYNIQHLDINADTGEVVLLVLSKKDIHGNRPQSISKSNGKDVSNDLTTGV